MSKAIRCDICFKIGTEAAIGWKRISEAGYISVPSFSEMPIEHICDEDWAFMLGSIKVHRVNMRAQEEKK
jgi:hypothetical protein